MFNSERLRKLRKDLNLTQVEMSEKLDLRQSSYSKYESNKADINLHLLQKLKDVFNVDPNEFIITQSNPVDFKNEGTLNGNGVVQSENYYEFPKEIVDLIVANQKSIIELMNSVAKPR